MMLAALAATVVLMLVIGAVQSRRAWRRMTPAERDAHAKEMDKWLTRKARSLLP